MSIVVEVQANGLTVNDRLEEYVQKKAGKLDKYLAEVEGARVELSHMKSARQASDRFVAQITLRGKKVLLRAEERADDIYVAFDAAIDKVQRRMERFKGKRNRGKDRVSMGEAAMEIIQEELAEEMAEDELPMIARRKKFTLFPMDEYEALEQMELLGHEDFFIFFNMDTSSVNVLYHRRDGSYGLIDTELV
ncbi:MAG TPA: ribosome-associated translation inhibitor RaiA [Anaerolineales bacterium]|nr:ribosome-associated translation inhibitor RaiA [Anaerolineales bacterium]